MPLELRVACETDAKEIAALVNRAYRPSPQDAGWTHEANLVAGERTTTEQVLSLFHEQSTILLLCLGSKIVACVHVQGDPSGAYIGMLATDPKLQAQGLVLVSKCFSTQRHMPQSISRLLYSKCRFYLHGQNSWHSTSGAVMFLPGR
jgi:hypothetical protein